MTAADGRAAADDDGRLLASDAERELVIETLKDAFVQGRLTKDEFAARAGHALAARTRADLAAVTDDIPADSAAAKPPKPAVPAQPVVPAEPVVPDEPAAPARRWPLAKAAAGSGACLASAFGLILFAANVLDPAGLGNPYHPWSSICGFFAMILLCTSAVIMAGGVNASLQQRRARKQLATRPGPDGRAPGELAAGTPG